MPPPGLPQDEWEEDGKWTTAAQSLFLILFFFAAVVFGADLNFSRKPLQAAAVVSLIPTPSAPAPKPKPVSEPAPEPEPKPEPPKPDDNEIALKKKLAEKKRKEKEKKQKAAAEEKERKKKDREKKEREKREEEAQKEKKRQAELAAEQAAADAARQEALDGIINGYLTRIKHSIEPFLITPEEVKGVENLVVVVEVNLNADGTLVGFPEVVESSGFPEYDEAAYRAVLKAAPLPMPKDPELLEEFRNLRLHISPE